MRILTVIAGLLISGCGAFCFAFYTNTFSDVAFIVGMVMVVAGTCHIVSYLVSGRGKERTTDTALVEGLVTLLYGFAVLNNQVTDLMLTMFFGTWLTLCGVTRFSQSLYVSRYNAKNWAQIIPLALVSGMLGVVMMMPKLVAAVMPLMLVGGAFICDGLSILVYAMNVKKRSASSESEIKAHERAAARKAAAFEKRAERDRLRELSRHERNAELARQKREQQAAEEAKRIAKEEERAAKSELLRVEKTVQLSDEEVSEINAQAAETELMNPESADLGETSGTAEGKSTVINVTDDNPMAAIWANMAEESGADIKVNKVTGVKDEPVLRPVWQKPKDIPSVRADIKSARAEEQDDDDYTKIKFTAVNLEEIESEKHEVHFDKVELPELKFESDDKTASRADILKEISSVTAEKADVDYTPISLEELVAEPLAKPYDPAESKRFTQTLNFGWLEDVKNE